MATVEDDEGAVVMTKPKKKSGSDHALEKFALATVAKSTIVLLIRIPHEDFNNNRWQVSLKKILSSDWNKNFFWANISMKTQY